MTKNEARGVETKHIVELKNTIIDGISKMTEFDALWVFVTLFS